MSGIKVKSKNNVNVFKPCFCRECPRGILIEAYFSHDLEVRVVSIFGHVIVGGTDSGLKMDRSGKILAGNTEEKWVK